MPADELEATVSPDDETRPSRATSSPEPVLDVTPETPGRYHLRGEVARGGQSVVYLAFDAHLGRAVAFKQPRLPEGAPPEFVAAAEARFLREARVTATLEHPNIVPVYEIGRGLDGKLYCTQKLILPPKGEKEPRTLGRALDESRTLDERLRLLHHVAGACQALAFAHEHGVIHRDVKPDNVVIGPFGETVLLDWGLAKVRRGPRDDARAPATQAVGETLAGYALGTPSYMSPQQARGELDQIDERSDVWSLGAMLYEVLTGEPPFRADTAQATVQQVLDAPLVPVRQRCEAAPPELAAVAEKALQKDPAGRYPSARALADELAAYLSGSRVGVYRYSAWEILRLFVSRHRAVAAVSAAAVVLLAAAAALLWSSYLQSQRYLASVRENLAVTLIDKARDAERNLQWDRAAAYYAAARVQSDLPEARLGAQLTSNRAKLGLSFLRGNGPGVNALDYSPDGKTLAVGSSDGSVHLWDLSARRPSGRLEGHHDAITSVRVSADGKQVVTASDDHSVRLWDLATRRELGVLYQGQDRLNGVAFSPDGRTVFAGTEDRLALIIDLASREVKRLEGHAMAVYGVDVSPDGRFAVSASRDQTVRLWDLSAGGPAVSTPPLGGPLGSLLAIRVSPDARRFATAGHDTSVRLWRVDELRVDKVMEGHTRKVLALAFSPGGDQLASGGADKTVRLWDVSSGLPRLADSTGVDGEVRAVAFAPVGRQLAWAGDGDAVWLRALSASAAPGSDEEVVLALAASPDGRFIAHGEVSDLVVRDAASFAQEVRLPIESPVLLDVRFSPDGRRLAYVHGKLEVRVLEVGSWREVSRFRAESREVNALAFSPDGRLLASAGRDAVVRLSEVETGKPMGELKGHADGVFGLAFSPDGKTIASGSYDKTVRLWDVAMLTSRATLSGHLHGIRRVAFSPDGRLLASASWDTTVRLWDASTGAPGPVLRGHEDHVFGLAFSPDGRMLATGGRDGTLRLWNLEGRELARYVADESWVHSIAFAPDGRSLVYADRRLHRLEFPELSAPRPWFERVLQETGLELVGTEFVRPALR